MLKNSSLDWTLIRPPAILSTAPAGVLAANEKNLPEITVNLKDLADFMIQQISSTDWIRKASLITGSNSELLSSEIGHGS